MAATRRVSRELSTPPPPASGLVPSAASISSSTGRAGIMMLRIGLWDSRAWRLNLRSVNISPIAVRGDPGIASRRGGKGPMPNPNEPRLILVVPAQDELDRDDLRRAYEDWNWDEVDKLLKQRLDKLPNPDRTLAGQFEVVALPSNAPIPQGLDIPPAEFRKMLVFGIVMSSGRAAEALAKNIREAFGEEASVGADLPVNAA